MTAKNDQGGHDAPATQAVHVPPLGLEGLYAAPARAHGLILFAHGSGSSRFSPRNTAVARALQRAGFATLLFDLLTEQEQADRANVFDIPLLSTRLADAVSWAETDPDSRGLSIGLFGSSTGAAAALVAAANRPDAVGAVVSRGGRPDLAGDALAGVRAPTLLIVGGADDVVLDLNRQAMTMLTCEIALEVVPGATHLFEESDALDVVVNAAIAWFRNYLSPPAGSEY